jgi:hypothetical protein
MGQKWVDRGRTARTENRRHYYIAKIDKSDILGPQILTYFDLADPPS